jgi:hypothetical protein
VEQALEWWADGRLDISNPAVYGVAPDAALAVLAREHGWAAVRGPGPMTWREAAASLQLIAEERYGAPRRAVVYDEKAREDRAAEAAKSALEDT